MKKSKRILRILAAAAAITAAAALAVIPAGAEDTGTTGTQDEAAFSYVMIGGLRTPRAGAPLDKSAVVSVLGYEWEIPVIWTDSKGDPAEIAEAGKSYTPFFAFYIPEKYDCPEIRMAMENAILFQNFIKHPRIISGEYRFEDSDAEIFYIACDAIYAETDDDEYIVEPDVQPEPDPKPEPKPVDPKEAEIYKYCRNNSKEMIEKYGKDTLLALIAQVKYVVEPQAVNMLIDKIPAFKKAADNKELGKYIGLYIDDSKQDVQAAVGYIPMQSGNTYYRLLVNPNSIFVLDPDTNQYVFDPTKESSFENTLTHEFVHAFMVDYSRTGMEGISASDLKSHKELLFPDWFVEGTASTCDNCLNYRRNEYLYLGLEQGSESVVNYTDYNILINNYTAHPEVFDINSAGTYTMGYLASMYLYSMAEIYYTSDDTGIHPSGDRYTEATYMIDSEKMRNGFSNILEKLRSGSSLDSIIAEMSPVDDNGERLYSDTADFAKKFMTNDDGGMSADFSAHFLYYSIESTATKDAAGNMLVGINRPDTPFMTGEVTKTDFLAVPDDYDAEDVYFYGDGYVKSSVDAQTALKSGGCSDLDNDDEGMMSDGQQLEAAKETAGEDIPEVTEAASDETAAEAGTENTADETAEEIEEMTAETEETSDEPAEETVSGTDDDNGEAAEEEASEEEDPEDESEEESEEETEETLPDEEERSV